MHCTDRSIPSHGTTYQDFYNPSEFLVTYSNTLMPCATRHPCACSNEWMEKSRFSRLFPKPKQMPTFNFRPRASWWTKTSALRCFIHGYPLIRHTLPSLLCFSVATGRRMYPHMVKPFRPFGSLRMWTATTSYVQVSIILQELTRYLQIRPKCRGSTTKALGARAHVSKNMIHPRRNP